MAARVLHRCFDSQPRIHPDCGIKYRSVCSLCQQDCLSRSGVAPALYVYAYFQALRLQIQGMVCRYPYQYGDGDVWYNLYDGLSRLVLHICLDREGCGGYRSSQGIRSASSYQSHLRRNVFLRNVHRSLLLSLKAQRRDAEARCLYAHHSARQYCYVVRRQGNSLGSRASFDNLSYERRRVLSRMDDAPGLRT